MKPLGPWTTEDYEALSWHDAHVYGFRLEAFDDENGSADLVLDIDYILKWEHANESFLFTVCQAELRFHDVFRMRFVLDYATPTMGMCPFALADVEREALDFSTGYRSYRWRLPFNWPQGQFEFEAPGFTQKVIGPAVVQESQRLPPDKRRNLYAA